MKLPIDKIYILCMPSNKERFKNVKKILKDLDIENDIDIWYTTKRTNFNDSILETGNYIGAENLEDQNKRYTNGDTNIFSNVVNCAIEHYTIVKQAYLRGFNNIMILEDDVELVGNISKLTNIPEDCDVLRMACGDNDKYEDDIVYDDSRFWGTMANVYNRKFMSFYIEEFDRHHNYTADEPLAKMPSYFKQYFIHMFDHIKTFKSTITDEKAI